MNDIEDLKTVCRRESREIIELHREYQSISYDFARVVSIPYTIGRYERSCQNHVLPEDRQMKGQDTEYTTSLLLGMGEDDSCDSTYAYEEDLELQMVLSGDGDNDKLRAMIKEQLDLQRTLLQQEEKQKPECTASLSTPSGDNNGNCDTLQKCLLLVHRSNENEEMCDDWISVYRISAQPSLTTATVEFNIRAEDNKLNFITGINLSSDER